MHEIVGRWLSCIFGIVVVGCGYSATWGEWQSINVIFHIQASTTEEKHDNKQLKDKARPHTTFAANYMTAVLGIDSELWMHWGCSAALCVGEAAVPTYSMLSQGCERRCNSAKTPTRITHTKIGHYRKRSKLNYWYSEKFTVHWQSQSWCPRYSYQAEVKVLQRHTGEQEYSMQWCLKVVTPFLFL